MNVKELKKRADELIFLGLGDERLIVQMDKPGAYVRVNSLSVGYESYQGKIIINLAGNNRFSNFELKNYEWLREEFLKKISNLFAIQMGETLVARYRKQKTVCFSRREAEQWLYQKLDKEMEKSNND